MQPQPISGPAEANAPVPTPDSAAAGVAHECLAGQPEVDDDEYEYDDYEDRTCKRCHGTGGEPMDDGVTPCEACDGEGYKWWL